jgi:hypothetical protein
MIRPSFYWKAIQREHQIPDDVLQRSQKKSDSLCHRKEGQSAVISILSLVQQKFLSFLLILHLKIRLFQSIVITV